MESQDLLREQFSEIWQRYMAESSAIGLFRIKVSGSQDDFVKQAVKRAMQVDIDNLPDNQTERLKLKLQVLEQNLTHRFPMLLDRATILMLVSSFESFLIDNICAGWKQQPHLLWERLSEKDRKNFKKNQLDNAKTFEQLSAKGINKIRSMKEKYKCIAGFFDLDQLSDPKYCGWQVYEIFETRHVIVHNRGIISNQYQNRMEKCPFTGGPQYATQSFEVGKPRRISNKYVCDSHLALNKAAGNIHVELLEKFCGGIE